MASKILILVEGQTEERFVKDVLNLGCSESGLYFVPTIISTKIVKSGGHHKGGVTSYAHVRRDLHRLLPDTSAVAVTTMMDFYGLPSDFPEWENTGTCYQKVEAAEGAFGVDIDQAKFVPYLQLHEFEGLLFTMPNMISDAFGQKEAAAVQGIRDSFNSPEEINNGPTTHPSMRLLNLYPEYQKVPFGSLIAGRTGLAQIRASCSHFNGWLQKLEALAQGNL